ncbi:pilus assembly protein TadG-related protein [Aliirhizobium terrae]|uniref:pilus assembly protein TadG-related protein n=1 Tax=Terrirhizobium terrae TaxID=2926709 RepID=UPI0025752908|nr:pilus assembly protein TadG-related protein [Rhizobium sp. CC-CFT758]WJH40148.1 pilus assembly protein TadG-related protein [Rhizobium sp. CC-CFT758]
MTALILVPLIGAAGLAIDFGRALSLRNELMGAADAAALGAISQGTAGYKAIQQMKQDCQITIAQDDGRKLFLSQRSVSVENAFTDMPVEVGIDVQRKAGIITSVVSFSAHVPTTFMRLLGKNEMTITGSATAGYGAQGKSYTDFYMLLDNTPSMGIAATTAEIARMKKLTQAYNGRECAFACHVGYYDNKGKFIESQNTYQVAKNNKVTLRIDVVAKAAKTLIDRIVDTAAVNEQYRVASYSFGKYALEPGYRIDKLASLTLDMKSAGDATEDVALMTTDHDWFNDNALTSFDVALTAIGKEISGNGGGGASAADPGKIVYFVTDGVADHLKPGGKCAGSWEGEKGRCHEPINTAYCKALKDRKIKIAVLYTTYVPLDGDGTWDGYIKNVFANKIASKLQECASPELFFEVGPDDDMEAAMVKLFIQATGGTTGLRLTN